jgi:hypothetical protein
MGYDTVPWLHKGLEVQFKENDLTGEQVIDILIDKVRTKQPFCITRTGDGEYSIMSQNLALTDEWLQCNVSWKNDYNYCGVTLPDYEMRDKLIKAIKDSDIVGVFPNDLFAEKVFSSINYRPQTTVYAFFNVYTPMNRTFVNFIKENPPLLVGKLSGHVAQLFKQKLGIDVPGYYTQITKPSEIEQTMEFMKNTPHDWALVSAGVNAKIICAEMKKLTGKVYFDWGQASDVIILPKFKDNYYLDEGD